MKPPRGLTIDEAALWRRVTDTVKPLDPAPAIREIVAEPVPDAVARAPKPKGRVPPARPAPVPAAAPASAVAAGLDGTWERKLARAAVAPDFTLDLHGCTLDQAHHRLDSGLVQAKAMRARLVLLITGKPRPVDPADRGTHRGAIRAKVIDWLAAGPHGADIVAIRGAHRRHGGDGALYLVMRRTR
ncbi:MAG: Smr/MutS family protein [Croceibacterium sp.]